MEINFLCWLISNRPFINKDAMIASQLFITLIFHLTDKHQLSVKTTAQSNDTDAQNANFSIWFGSWCYTSPCLVCLQAYWLVIKLIHWQLFLSFNIFFLLFFNHLVYYILNWQTHFKGATRQTPIFSNNAARVIEK